MHIIKNIHIEKFRAFKNLDIPTDKNVVAIAGQNGTHKTTLLGLLAQSVTLSRGPFYKTHTIDGELFKTDMREKFKFSEQYDIIGEHLWTVSLDERIDKRGSFSVRSYPRNENDKSFFLRFWNNDNSRKQGTGFPQCPAIFLSLKRLFPIGETDSLNDEILDQTPEDDAFFKKWHNQILILLDEIVSIHSLSEQGTKASLGSQTKISDAKTISAGQDNIGKILQAVLSFSHLKRDYPNDYIGGLIFIDEIEATLYPAAQIKLLKFILKMAKELNLQFFFTTHSLTILKYLTSDEAIKTNETSLVYLKRNGTNIIAPANPNWSGILKDLTLNIEDVKICDKVEVFAEDDVTFEFLETLLPSKIVRLVSKQRQCTLGFNDYAKLQKQRIHEFATNIIVLDGDAFRGEHKLKDNEIKKYKNWLALPGKTYPEQDIYEYLWKKKDDADFWDNSLGGFNSQVCFQNITTYTKDKKQIKEWYRTVPVKIRKTFLRKYFSDNKDELEKFKVSFIHAYNHVTKFHGLPEILIP
jgi:energy-coupling factor transporter ATP-binding protein EcfA2